MAKNYTYAEAVKIIAEGNDLDAINDIGKRFPLLMHKTATVAALAGTHFVDLMAYMPEYITANKINGGIKKALTGSDDEGDDTQADDAPAGEAKAAAVKPSSGGTDYDSMSGKELWDLTGKVGIRKLLKSTKKADMIEGMKLYDAGKLRPALKAEKAEKAEPAEDVPNDAGKYDGKSAVELFKECKARGMKVEPKKPAKYYADMLTNDDEAAKSPANAEDDDDWGDEAPAPTSAKPAAKPAKQVKTEADDDWDI